MSPRRAVAASVLSALALPSTALAHGDRVARPHLAGAWSLPWPVLALALLGAGLFAQAVVRLRRRGRAADCGPGRIALFAAGLALLLLALASPLDAVGEDYLLSGHMLQHVLIGDAAPALLVVALRGPLTVFLLPAWLLKRLARAAPVRHLFSALMRPAVALAVWLAVYATWHVPTVYDSVLRRPLLHDAEHATFVVAGLLVWAQIVDPARRGALSRYRRLAYAVALFAAGQVLADLLVFSLHPLYPAYAHEPERLWGISPRLDQQLAGLVMMGEQLITLGIASALLLRPAFRARRRPVDETLAPGPA